MSNLAKALQVEATESEGGKVVSFRPPVPALGVREIFPILFLLPLIVLGSGYLMWLAPARQLFGQPLTSQLSLRAILEPGLLYTGTLALSAAFAYVLGLRRLQRPFKHLSRATLVVSDLLIWFLVAAVATPIAYAATYGGSFGIILDAPTAHVYMFGHIVLVGFGFRRLYGLLRSRMFSGASDRRQASSGLRLLEAGLAVALIFAQAPLAILFGALGPNPAKRVRAVEVQLAAPVPSTKWLLYVDQDRHRLLGFDAATRRIVGIPQDRILELQWTRSGK